MLVTLGDELRGTGAKAPVIRKSWRRAELGAGVPEMGLRLQTESSMEMRKGERKQWAEPRVGGLWVCVP